ncbi:neurofilament heavy polypeptide-like isoform X2 [Cydia pomonella]|uniref:neurofilament heavy polypeptide-like isoform X2 n=1 Tax=Cydia pomonella TaxID=82600 RepID=UPI002ADE6D6A|nr:neurofilament heavy polypeptide-like isoform X2 [Cydia pomonella]
MSQMVTRQRTGGDEKEKRQTDSPVKDMKKKMAANAEKEKNAAEQATSKPAEKPADKAEKPTDKTEKPAEKPAEKPKVAEKPADKKDKAPEKEKPAEKKDKPAEKEKPVEKKDKPAEKEKPVEKKDKPADKKEGQSEKKKEENGKGESSGKTEKPAANGRPKQNGTTNGTVSPDSDSVSDVDETEQFPELAYDDSDVEWEPGMDCPSRSLTRREQSKESKVLKLTDSGKDTPKDKKSDAKSDAKSDGKPEAKSDGKPEAKSDGKSAKTVAKTAETPKKEETIKADVKKDVKESPRKGGKEDKSERVEVEVVVEIENNGDASEESRKPDTNFSKSRVKVSPYRRSMRLADQTTSSIAANYTGNNTTMEMDITESSSFMDETMDDSYLSGLRSIRGRRSYKLLQELPPRGAAADRSGRSVASITVSEQSTRPTAPVVGRKRKPEPEDHISIASEAREADSPIGKRQRLLEKLARPFRKTVLMPARRNAEIVGINTDLPLTAPVASTSRFDPETLKAASDTPAPPAAPPALAAPAAEDAKRCVIM